MYDEGFLKSVGCVCESEISNSLRFTDITNISFDAITKFDEEDFCRKFDAARPVLSAILDGAMGTP